MKRTQKITLLAFCALLPMLMAPTGGFPSRPRFQSVGVNLVAPSTAGNINISGTYQINGVSLGVPITCTTACNISTLAVGQTAYVIKTADTARSSTVVQTADPDLQFTNAVIGSYAVDGSMHFVGTGGGVIHGLASSASLVGGTLSFDVNGIVIAIGSTCPAATLNANYAIATTSTNAAVNCTSGMTDALGKFFGVPWLATTTGNLFVSWCQSTSNAGATTLKLGSWMRVTRLN